MAAIRSRKKVQNGRLKVPRRNTICSCLILIPLLASCSGGGGGGGNLQDNPSTGFLASVTEPSLPAVVSDWSGSQEYVNSTGLAQLRAAEGYARRSGGLPGGQGVRIAIIDSGIDVSHPDLGNLASQSWSAGDEALTSNSHATFVAGIAGARRTQSDDPNDIHGLAYQATLVNFQTSRPSVVEATGEVTFATGDLVEAIRTASGLDSNSAGVEADVLNLSLGGFSTSDSTFAALRTAMRAAAAEDKIMVLAAGNEGLDSDPDRSEQPIFPAAYADDSGIAGHAIVVGNLTSTNQVAPSSNLCGDTKDYCLFAPGSNIRSTLPGGLYGVGSGTSFAAPYVSGAAAVVKAAFPGVSNTDVVDRLLLTAADLGPAGVDSTFGRGLLDLEAAMAPVGPTGFPIGPTVDGPTVTVASSALRLGPGLQLGRSARERLGEVMTVDEMGFPFPIDLAANIEATPRDSGLVSFVGHDGMSITSATLPKATIAAILPDADVQRLEPLSSNIDRLGSDSREQRVPLSFNADVTNDAQIFARLYGAAEPELGLEDGLLDRDGMFLQANSFLSPYNQWADDTAGAGFRLQPADNAEIALSMHTSIEDGGGPSRSLQRLEAKIFGPANIEFRLGFGLVQEEGGFLGGSASGAFDQGSSAQSQFLTVSALGPLTKTIDWFGSYSRGQSSISSDDATLITDWSDAQSEAFGLGFIMRDVASDGDGLSIMVGQPLRQERVRATVSLPVARLPNGDVVRETDKIDLTPSAREIATEIGYRLPLDEGGGHDLRAAGFLRLRPDHDRSRDPEAGLGLVYRWRF